MWVETRFNLNSNVSPPSWLGSGLKQIRCSLAECQQLSLPTFLAGEWIETAIFDVVGRNPSQSPHLLGWGVD